MPVRDSFPTSPSRRLLGITACLSLLAGPCAALASELISPLPPRAMPPAPAARQPLAPVTGQHVRPRVCEACCGECRGAACPANCPVRPDEFGFYETQWRTWPTETTRRAAEPESLTPVSPPRSEVPGVDEESLQRPAGDMEADMTENTAAPLPAPRIPVPDRRRAADAPEPRTEAAERAPAPRAEPEPLQPEKEPPAEPAPKRPAVPAEDENLFDEARRLPRAAVLALANQRVARQPTAAGDDDRLRSSTGIALVGHDEPVVEQTSRTANPLRASSGRATNPLRHRIDRGE